LLFAVSKSSDPTAGWTGFAIPFNGPIGNFADFPTLGLNRDGVFLYSNGSVTVFPKQDLLSTAPTIANATVLNSPELLTPTGSKLQPVVDLDRSGQPEAIIGSWDVEGTNFKRSNIVGNIYSPILDTSDGLIAVTPYAGLGNTGAKQPDTSITINTSSQFFSSSVVLQNGVMWGVQGVAYRGRAALRWFAIDATNNALLQEGLLSDPNRDFYMGSIAVNKFDDVVIGFNISSESEFVSSYAVRGTTDHGRTVFGEPILLKAGLAPYSAFTVSDPPVARWGDYSATVVDPDDPRVFWTVQQWVSQQDFWSTQITQLCLAPGQSQNASAAENSRHPERRGNNRCNDGEDESEE
jgi:hypothetical protein